MATRVEGILFPESSFEFMFDVIIWCSFPFAVANFYLSSLSDRVFQEIFIHQIESNQYGDDNHGIFPIVIPREDYIGYNLNRYIHLPEPEEMDAEVIILVIWDTTLSHSGLVGNDHEEAGDDSK